MMVYFCVGGISGLLIGITIFLIIDMSRDDRYIKINAYPNKKPVTIHPYQVNEYYLNGYEIKHPDKEAMDVVIHYIHTHEDPEIF